MWRYFLTFVFIAGSAVAGNQINPDFVAPAGSVQQIDASSDPPDLTGLNLLGTLNANGGRRGFLIQVQDSSANCAEGIATDGVLVAFDSGSDGTPVTTWVIAYATAKGSQGGSLDATGVPHTGRIRFFGKVGCRVAAAQW
jgi:hypothetical protein